MVSQSSATPHDDYVLGHTSEEYRRLRAQAQLLEPATRPLLQQTGLREGMTCLDVGCGPGEVMRLMGEFAGPSGSVTGLDIDGRLGREALGVLQAAQAGRFTFVEANVETVEDVPGAPFDLVFARLVLMYVRDPLAALGKLYAWMKPGGCLVVQDYDVRTVDIYPRPGFWEEFERVVFGSFEQGGADVRFGRKLPALLVDAGIGPPDGTDVFGLLTGFEQASGIIQGLYRSVLPRALQLGLTTEAQSQAFFAAVSRSPGERYYGFLWPLLIGAWKRKPA